MNSTIMIISIAILIILYPFFLYFKLSSFKKKLNDSQEELNELLEQHHNDSSDKLAEDIHTKRRAYNQVVRVNNHTLDSRLGRLLAKKYHFEEKDSFTFQGR